MSRPVVIGIAGGSGSGKTTVIRRILQALPVTTTSVIPHDAYYKDLGTLPLEERKKINYDHPEALDTDLLLEHLHTLLSGGEILKPVYDYNEHRRRSEVDRITPTPIIIIDGILVLAEKALAAMMDIKIFVDADSDVRLLRRIRRDIAERGRTIDDIIEQYEATVRPMYLQFVEPSKRRADIIIPRGGFNSVAIDMVVSRIRTLLEDFQ